MRKDILHVSDLGYQIRGHWVTRNTTFTLREGITALVGPNGAGKSSLLRTMTGVYSPDTGHVTAHEEGDSLRKIAYIPQFPGAYDYLTVRQQLKRSQGWDSGSIRGNDRTVDEMLQLWGLQHIADRLGMTLQASDKRRLALASAWMRRVAVLLFDEPTAGLDAVERLRFWQQVFTMKNRRDAPRGYLVTTHLLDEVEQYCDDILLLIDGEVVEHSTVEDFIQRAHGQTFYAPTPGLPDLRYTGQRDQGGYLVVSRDTADLPPRPPNLHDAYLIKTQVWEGLL